MKANYLLKTLLILIFLLQSSVLLASGLPLPRFVSTKSDTVNVRSGPGLKYPIIYVYKKKNLPLEVIAEVDHWRQVKDVEGSKGWINRTMLSGKRNFVVKGVPDIFLYEKNGGYMVKLARLETGVEGEIIECPPDSEFCEVSLEDYNGYVKRTDIFGVYNHETID